MEILVVALHLIIYTVVLLTSYAIYCYLKWQQHKRLLKNVGSPRALPIFGTVFEFNNSKTFLNDINRLVATHGKIVRMNMRTDLLVIVADYKLLEFLLSSNKIIDKAKVYRFIHTWLGTGLLTSTAHKWRKHRKMITPAYHFSILDQFVETFDSASGIFVRKLRAEVEKDGKVARVDVYPLVSLLTLDVICETAMGTNIKAQLNNDSEYVNAVKEMSNIVIHKTFSPLQVWDPLFLLAPSYKRERKVLKILHDHTAAVINQRRKALANAGDNKIDESGDEFGRKKKIAFLDLLLQSTVDGRGLTDQELREEVDTFMFEGHDTTASAVSFAIFSLAAHPEVQAKALAEQRAIFGDDPHRKTTMRDLQEMKYLELVIKETLRLYPSVPFYGRETTEEIQYKNITFPKGTNFMLFAYGIQRDPEYFKDPLLFNPDRFAEDTGRQPFSFIAFSAGPRNCIGQKFAMLEMKSSLGKAVRNFKFSAVTPEHKLDLVAETILKSANGTPVNVELRKW